LLRHQTLSYTNKNFDTGQLNFSFGAESQQITPLLAWFLFQLMPISKLSKVILTSAINCYLFLECYYSVARHSQIRATAMSEPTHYNPVAVTDTLLLWWYVR